MALAQRNNRWRYVFVLVAGMVRMNTWLTGCASLITHHDDATYKNLTDLKAEAVILVETFDTKPFAGNEPPLRTDGVVTPMRIMR